MLNKIDKRELIVRNFVFFKIEGFMYITRDVINA